MGDFLFGGSGSSGFNTQVVTPTLPPVANQELLNGAALWRLLANSPYLSAPFRPVDYFRNQPVAQNMVPQYQGPQSMPYYPTGGLGFMTNFQQNPMGANMLPFLLGNLGQALMQQQMLMPQQQQQQMLPTPQPQVEQPQQQGGQA